MRVYLFATLTGLAIALAPPSQAKDIIEDWNAVKAPAAPEVRPVTADPKTSALLVLDFQSPNCPSRPRCMASLPAMKKLLAEARAKAVLVVYSNAGKATPADIMKDIAPAPGDPVVHASVDKFAGTDLKKI